MVDIAEGSSIVALRGSTAERQIMVLDIACSGNRLVEVGIISLVVIFQAILLGGGNIFGSIQHLHALIHRIDAIIAFVRNLKSLARALLGLHLDDT